MCAGKVMGPGGEAIKSLSERTGCSVVVEGKSPNAAFVPFRLVNYLAPGAPQIAAAVAEVVELICQEEKYEAGEAAASGAATAALQLPRPCSFRRAALASCPACPAAGARPILPRRKLGCTGCTPACCCVCGITTWCAAPRLPTCLAPCRPCFACRHSGSDLCVLPHHRDP